MPLPASSSVRVGLIRMQLEANEQDSARMRRAADVAHDRLYILLEGDWSQQSRSAIQGRLKFIYDLLSLSAPRLDARVLLPSEEAWLARSAEDAEAIICCKEEEDCVDRWMERRTERRLPAMQKLLLDLPCCSSLTSLGWDEGTCMLLPPGNFQHVVLGGTFDRIHAGHKLLLSMTCVCASERVLIGVSTGPLLEGKTMRDVMQPFEQRQVRLLQLLQSLRDSVRYEIVPISDPFGPSIVDEQLQCIVVSRETERGGHSVNKRRVDRNLNELVVDVVDLVGPEDADDSNKMSSTMLRRTMLGSFNGADVNSLCRQGGEVGEEEFVRCTSPDVLPYIVGLTGGIASGKSTISGMLKEEGCEIVDCDKLGHRAYLKGSETFKRVVEAFGSQVVDPSSGEIDRRSLASIVFGDAEQMKVLNGIVWPAIRELAVEEMKGMRERGVELCVMEAAVLLEACWDDFVDEVWTVIVPEEKSKERLMKRNNISEEDAKKRISAQMTNQDRMKRSDIIISNEWDTEQTNQQVKKALQGVKNRMSSKPPIQVQQDSNGNNFLSSRWFSCCRSLKVDDATQRSWWRLIRQKYSGVGRYYHNTHHLRDMFVLLQEFAISADRQDLLYLAIFFHDVVYDATRTDNEEASVKFFQTFCNAARQISREDQDLVCKMIMSTKHDADHDRELKGDFAILNDLDLSILGSQPSKYSKYAENVQMEFSPLPFPTFLARRKEFLSKMLSKTTIFSADVFRRHLEDTARSNMDREIAKISRLCSLNN